MHHIFHRCIFTDQLAGGPESFVDQTLIGRDLRRRQDQRRIGGCIPWRELADRLKIPCVRDDNRHLGKLLQQACHCLFKGCFFNVAAFCRASALDELVQFQRF